MIEYDEKNQKYIVCNTLCSNRKHDCNFIEYFVMALKANGFSNFHVIVPVNSKSADKCIRIEDFFEMKYCYCSQIILGDNQETGDSVKALLVDIKSKSSFDDKDFSNGYDNSEVLVRSSNPVRAFYLVNQLQLFTEMEGKKRFFSRGSVHFLFFTSVLFLFLNFLKSGKAAISISQNRPVNIVLSILLLFILFSFTVASIADSMKGLCISNNNKKSFKNWLKRLNSGDFNNYLVVRIASHIFAGIIGAVISNLIKK